jgi:hypothetical protein
LEEEMAAYIYTEGRDDYILWYVGGSPWITGKEVTAIQADGHELEAIRKKFTNIPDAPGERVVLWRGEIAQFIVDNL